MISLVSAYLTYLSIDQLVLNDLQGCEYILFFSILKTNTMPGNNSTNSKTAK